MNEPPALDKYKINAKVINMYDFLTSLTIFLKKKTIKKIRILMQLMDVDEDFCLSILEIQEMLSTSYYTFTKKKYKQI